MGRHVSLACLQSKPCQFPCEIILRLPPLSLGFGSRDVLYESSTKLECVEKCAQGRGSLQKDTPSTAFLPLQQPRQRTSHLSRIQLQRSSSHLFDVCSVTATQEVNSSRLFAEYPRDFEEDWFAQRVPAALCCNTRLVSARARLFSEQIL